MDEDYNPPVDWEKSELPSSSIWPDIGLTILGGVVCGLTAAFTLAGLLWVSLPAFLRPF